MIKIFFILIFCILQYIYSWDSNRDLKKIISNTKSSTLIFDEISPDECFEFIDEFSDFTGNIEFSIPNVIIRIKSKPTVFDYQNYQQYLKHLNLIFIDLPPPFKF